MARRYRKVEVPMWTDQKFRELSGPDPSGRHLWLYLLSGTRTTVFPGLIVATPAVLAGDLGWPLDPELGLFTASPTPFGTPSSTPFETRPRCLRDALSEITEKGMAKVDSRSGVIVLTKALFNTDGSPRDSSKPSSSNQLKGWEKGWPDIPECPLKDEYLLDLKRFVTQCSTALARAFATAFKTHLGRVGDGVRDASPIRSHPGTGTGTGGRSGRSESLPLSGSRSLVASGSGSSGDQDLDQRLPGDRDLFQPAPGLLPFGPQEAEVARALAAVDPRLGHRDETSWGNGDRSESLARSLAGQGGAPESPTRAPNAPGAVLPDPELLARRALAQRWWNRMNELRANLAAELGITTPRNLHFHLPGFGALLDRVRESGEHAEADLEHVFAIAVAEARASKPPSLQYLSGSMFEPRSWAFKLGMSEADAAKPRPGGHISTDAFAAVDATTRAIEQAVGRSMVEDAERRGPRAASSETTSTTDDHTRKAAP